LNTKYLIIIMRPKMHYRTLIRTTLFLAFLRTKRRVDIKRASAAFILLIFTLLTLLNSVHHHQSVIINPATCEGHFNKEDKHLVRLFKEIPVQECAACEWTAAIGSTITASCHHCIFNEVSQPYFFLYQQKQVIKTNGNPDKGRAPPVV
jgi:hypothetical protein